MNARSLAHSVLRSPRTNSHVIPDTTTKLAQVTLAPTRPTTLQLASVGMSGCHHGHESVVDEPASSEMDRAPGGEIDIVDDIQRSLYQNGISQIEKYSGGEIEGPAPDKSHFIRNGEEIVIVKHACIGVT